MEESQLDINGTLIWYYYICPREVWLMVRQIVPDQDNENIDLGRFIQEDTYKREKKEISIGNIRLDLVRKDKGKIVVGEVKKSSKYEESAKMQLAFYLSELKLAGIEAIGELLFPKERKKVSIELTDDILLELEQAKKHIKQIINLEKAPEVKKIAFCKNCAYGEFCWA